MLFCSRRISLDRPHVTVSQSRIVIGCWTVSLRQLFSCTIFSSVKSDVRPCTCGFVRLGSFIRSWCADTCEKLVLCAMPPVNAHSSRSALTELRIDTIDIVKGLLESNFSKWHYAHQAIHVHTILHAAPPLLYLSRIICIFFFSLHRCFSFVDSSLLQLCNLTR